MQLLRSHRCFNGLAVVLVVSLLAFIGETRAQDPEQLAAELQDTYEAVNSMSFSFSQTTSGPMTGRPKSGKGNGLYARTADKPLMRWNYLTPDPQVIISDGKTISMYFEKLNQLIFSEVDEAQTDILLSFFAASEPLDRHFTILPPFLETDISAEELPEMQSLRLEPLDKNSQIKNIHLWIGENSIIRRIELLDHFDTRTTINLSNIAINPLETANQQELEKLFTFVPPEGTEIIRQ
ncbi:MAG: outer membrane lipoprotein carrier protein LolA [Desulfofustis sp.]|nr:outer membrane lipoprotein carrier protein LolA [Desulfofustis sp.]MBT8352935.1 outer membrane lipoprotein carrier protein LolA [Desulfofustis sp.]NNK14234.1 outer membrane lipoprotein carrier protein LolA [Desulfofustis sp.]